MINCHTQISGILDYWRFCKGSALLPHKKNLSGTNLRKWVGDVSIIHVHDGPKRFFVSLHGSNVNRHIGPDFNKKYLEDAVPQKTLGLSLAPYIESMNRHVPVYAVMMPTLSNGLHSKLERLVMPFCGDREDTVERFLVWVAPSEKNPEKYTLADDLSTTRIPEGVFSLFEFCGDQPVEINLKKNFDMKRTA